MTTADSLRNSIIDKLLTIKDTKYLAALDNILEKSSNDIVYLNKAQIEMLEMSELDILNENLISQEEMDKEDLEWLKGL